MTQRTAKKTNKRKSPRAVAKPKAKATKAKATKAKATKAKPVEGELVPLIYSEEIAKLHKLADKHVSACSKQKATIESLRDMAKNAVKDTVKAAETEYDFASALHDLYTNPFFKSEFERVEKMKLSYRSIEAVLGIKKTKVGDLFKLAKLDRETVLSNIKRGSTITFEISADADKRCIESTLEEREKSIVAESTDRKAEAVAKAESKLSEAEAKTAEAEQVAEALEAEAELATEELAEADESEKAEALAKAERLRAKADNAKAKAEKADAEAEAKAEALAKAKRRAMPLVRCNLSHQAIVCLFDLVTHETTATGIPSDCVRELSRALGEHLQSN